LKTKVGSELNLPAQPRYVVRWRAAKRQGSRALEPPEGVGKSITHPAGRFQRGSALTMMLRRRSVQEQRQASESTGVESSDTIPLSRPPVGHDKQSHTLLLISIRKGMCPGKTGYRTVSAWQALSLHSQKVRQLMAVGWVTRKAQGTRRRSPRQDASGLRCRGSSRQGGLAGLDRL
jgi:hypothetical protein